LSGTNDHGSSAKKMAASVVDCSERSHLFTLSVIAYFARRYEQLHEGSLQDGGNGDTEQDVDHREEISE
jgi:hypothetical protein